MRNCEYVNIPRPIHHNLLIKIVYSKQADTTRSPIPPSALLTPPISVTQLSLTSHIDQLPPSITMSLRSPLLLLPSRLTFTRQMATNPYLAHIDRTAASPRDSELHPTTLTHITPANPSIRLLRLTLKDHQQGMRVRPPSLLASHP